MSDRFQICHDITAKREGGWSDHSQTVKKICRAPLSFMQSLKIWKSFGKGRERRVANIEACGVVLAIAAMGASPKAVVAVVEKTRVEATKSAEASDKVIKARGKNRNRRQVRANAAVQ